MQSFLGQGVGSLVAMGRAKLWLNTLSRAEGLQLTPEKELERFQQARAAAKAELEELYQRALTELGEEKAGILEFQQLMLEDQDYAEAVEAALADGLAAEAAVIAAGEEMAELFLAADDEYTQARALDVRDMSKRLQRCLTGNSAGEWSQEGPVVLLAEDLTPSETLQFPKDKLLGFVTSGGSLSSHTAILAKSLGIPAVVALGINLKDVAAEAREVIVDAGAGKVIIDPDEATKKEYEKAVKSQEQKKRLREKLKGLPAVTRSGRAIRLYANIGNTEDAEQAVKNDAEGVGLFRSEFLFLKAKTAPTEEEQFRAYSKVLKLLAGKEVIIRTLDIGADKKAPYLNLPQEENPALGLRAIRVCLTREDIFRTQLRALCRASVAGRLSIMLPMIISPDEVKRAKKLLKEVRAELKAEGCKVAPGIKLGVMIETPAAALCSDSLAKMVDFFSIGTNDLTQYTLAIDRQNAALESFLDRHHPAVLRLMELTVKNAHEAGIPVGICGELGADAALTKKFLEWGVDELSVAPASILPLRDRIRKMK